MILIYVTYPDEASAQAVSKALLEARLVACANIFPAHRSLYWWEGEIADEAEVAVIYKTRRDRFEAVEAAIKERHPYDVPCIVSVPVEKAQQDFMGWVREQTRER